MLLLEWCVRFGAGLLMPLQDAAASCCSRLLLSGWCVRFGAGLLVPLPPQGLVSECGVRCGAWMLAPFQGAAAVELGRWCRCRGSLRDLHGSVGVGAWWRLHLPRAKKESVWLLPKNILCYLGVCWHIFFKCLMLSIVLLLMMPVWVCGWMWVIEPSLLNKKSGICSHFGTKTFAVNRNLQQIRWMPEFCSTLTTEMTKNVISWYFSKLGYPKTSGFPYENRKVCCQRWNH